MATATATASRTKMLSARRFIGKDIFDVRGQHVGEVEDLILDVDTACAKWSILSSGGVMGIGGKDYIVPIQTVSIEHDSGRLMLSFDEQRLRNAPKYDRDNPPDWADEAWMRSLYAYYGIQQGASGGQGWEQGWQEGYREGSRQQNEQTYAQGSQQSGHGQQQGYQQQGEGYGRETGEGRAEREQAGQPIGGHQKPGVPTGQQGGGPEAYGPTTSGQDTREPGKGDRDYVKRT